MGVAADSASASRERFMRIALQMAERGMAAGGPPVGACLVRDNAVVSSAHNSVIGELDATAHAEVVAIRQGCRELRALQLSGCELYVTVEPCPMCLSACHYAGIDRIYFGAPISEMQAITGNELCIDRETLFQNNAGPTVSGGLFEDDCIALLKQWQDGGA